MYLKTTAKFDTVFILSMQIQLAGVLDCGHWKAMKQIDAQYHIIRWERSDGSGPRLGLLVFENMLASAPRRRQPTGSTHSWTELTVIGCSYVVLQEAPPGCRIINGRRTL